jgi:hypothetical protein
MVLEHVGPRGRGGLAGAAVREEDVRVCGEDDDGAGGVVDVVEHCLEI